MTNSQDIPDDLIALLENTAEAMRRAADAAIRKAYDMGRVDGSMAMRDMILNAVTKPASVQPSSSFSAVASMGHRTFNEDGTETPESVARRAPRGLVTEAIREALTEKGGQTAIELEGVVRAKYPEIAAKSIGNELRRREDSSYWRQGFRWFLIKDDDETSSAEGSNPSADILDSNQKGGEAQ